MTISRQALKISIEEAPFHSTCKEEYAMRKITIAALLLTLAAVPQGQVTI